MPTRRTTTILITAGLLYLFANQTQVGWMYVMAALLVGIVAASLLLNRFTLGGLTAGRDISAGDALHEGDEARVNLRLHNRRALPAAQVSVTEQCPLTAPDDERRERTLFVPAVRDTAEFAYAVTLYRRGLHAFPAAPVSSRAPFGFFRANRTLEGAAQRVLVYPQVEPLRRLRLFDRQPTPELVEARTGRGMEVIGVRDYRPGDSPRHIHWRSVARRGTLITKEFAEEKQPGLTLALDLFAHPYPAESSKHTPFEWGVKAAASIAEYAVRLGYPLSIAADETALPAPRGPLTWEAVLQYLARVEPQGRTPLGDVLAAHPVGRFAAVILPWPDPAAGQTLLGLRARGIAVLAVLLDPATFPAGGPSAGALAASLRANHMDVTLLSFGVDWAAALAEEIPA